MPFCPRCFLATSPPTDLGPSGPSKWPRNGLKTLISAQRAARTASQAIAAASGSRQSAATARAQTALGPEGALLMLLLMLVWEGDGGGSAGNAGMTAGHSAAAVAEATASAACVEINH